MISVTFGRHSSPRSRAAHEFYHDPEANEAPAMSSFRTGRRRYCDMFSLVYDAFIRLHCGRGEQDTRHFLSCFGNP